MYKKVNAVILNGNPFCLQYSIILALILSACKYLENHVTFYTIIPVLRTNITKHLYENMLEKCQLPTNMEVSVNTLCMGHTVIYTLYIQYGSHRTEYPSPWIKGDIV